MSSESSQQALQRAQRAARRGILQEEAEPSSRLGTPPPLPPRAQTPSSSPEQSRTSLPYEPRPFAHRTPSRIPLPPSPPIPSSTRAMSDDGRREVTTKLNTKNLEFNGKKADYRAWRDRIDLYMIGNPSQLPDDGRKIAFTLSWICGSKDAQVWASNQQRKLSRATTWGTWREFQKTLEDAFGDPAAENQAREYLLNFKQDDQKARPFYTMLELWFNLANITDDEQKYQMAKRAINSKIRSSLLLVDFPDSYDNLKKKMIMLDDEEDKVRAFNPKSLNSRLGDSSTTAARQYTPASQAYRAQGHTPAREQ